MLLAGDGEGATLRVDRTEDLFFFFFFFFGVSWHLPARNDQGDPHLRSFGGADGPAGEGAGGNRERGAEVSILAFYDYFLTQDYHRKNGRS